MNLNATLLGQMITFAVFIWFTMKFVWPPITKAMREREKRIADGLAAAEQGGRDLELAQHRASEILEEARQKAAKIIEQANERSLRMIEQAKEDARKESEQLIKHANSQIAQAAEITKRELQTHVSDLAIKMTEKLLQQHLNTEAQRELLKQRVNEV
jgi:F-type H+-transporting ATPase subunit b